MGRSNGSSRILLPQNGLAVREEQITLCHAMLDTLLKNNIALMRRGRRDRQDLRLPDRLHFTEEVCPTWACRFPAGGGLHLQRCSAGRYHRGIHPVFIPDFSGEPHYSKTHPGDGAKRERTLCLRCPSCRCGWKPFEEKKKNAEQMKALLSLRSYYDLDAVTGLSGFDQAAGVRPQGLREKLSFAKRLPVPSIPEGSQKRGDFRPDLQSQLSAGRRRPPFAGNAAPSQ